MFNSLFCPFRTKSLEIQNRIVMAPMTRAFARGGVPADEAAAYYRRRAEGGVGLILSEGTVVNRPSSANNPDYPHFYGDLALKKWKSILDAVHAAGGKMAPQLWHLGIVKPHASGWLPPAPFEGPSGLVSATESGGVAMSEAAIVATVGAFVEAAWQAKDMGFDAIELHGAHGYLIDQFFWDQLNRRTDRYGGKTLRERSQFAIDIVSGIRRRVGPDFPIILRLSQWKQQDYETKIAKTPQEMEEWLVPLAEAGVDVFHCSQRRFWEPEFAGSDLNFAGWAKKITGRPSITVGSVGLSGEFLRSFRGESSAPAPLDRLMEMFARGDFDLVALGRTLISDPAWPMKIRDGKLGELKGFQREDLNRLY